MDLIATDPPFKKGRDFHATPESLAKGAKFQDRWSWEKDVHQEWVEQLEDDWPSVYHVIEGSRKSYGDDMGAFLCFMAVRLLEMKRVLKPTGSIYVHCDSSASHYLKELMDAVFGRKNFINDIIWQRHSAHNDGKRYGRITDTIIFYAKDHKNYTYNHQYTQYTDEYINEHFSGHDERGVFQTEPLTAESKQGGGYKYVFHGHDRVWTHPKKTMLELERQNRIYVPKKGKGVARQKFYRSELPGVPLQNLWTDIKKTPTRERTGFPTQKPVKLYQRIINTSSNENDIVLDPFCGCATTLIAAESLNRRWIGMDIWTRAHEMVITRMKNECHLEGPDGGGRPDLIISEGVITYEKIAPNRTDDRQNAVPFLRVKEKVHEPDGKKMSRKEMVDHLIQQNGTTCQGCDREFDDLRYLELDHNTPRSDGGLNHISNRILLCGPCNKLKSNILTLSGLRRKNKKLRHMCNTKPH